MKSIIFSIPSRHDFLKGNLSLERGYPWLTFGAIIFLEGIINKSFKILEFGSGGSTIFWANNCEYVKSYETNKQWFEDVKNRAKNFRNVNLQLVDNQSIFEKIDGEPNHYYDLILVDNDPKDVDRNEVLKSAISKVRRDGWVVIDNYAKFGMEKYSYPSNIKLFTFDELKYSGLGTKIFQLQP